MTKNIYLINERNALTELREQPYDSEALLQQLLADHAGVLAGNLGGDIEQSWLLVTREAPVPEEFDGSARWSLDHLFLDQHGVPTLVEVKRGTDTRIRREVVGQMLDYAANSVAYWPVERIQQMLEARCAKQGENAAEQLAPLLAARGSDETAFWLDVKTNLKAGRIRMVFVADEIPPSLQRIVEFLNEQMDPAEVIALEVRQYVSGNIRTLVPVLIGRTAEAETRKSVSTVAGERWNRDRFAEHLALKKLPGAGEVAEALLAWAQKQASYVWWGQGKTMGSFVPVITHLGVGYQLFAVFSNGLMEFYFQWLSVRPGFVDDAPRIALVEKLNQIDGVSIPLDAIRRRPSVPLTLIARPGATEQLIGVLDWLVEAIRAVPAEPTAEPMTNEAST